jgi:hypothetical protein
LSKAEVTGSSSGSTTIIGQPRRKLSPLYAIPVVLGIGGIAWANLTKPNSPPTDPVTTNPPPSTTQSQCPFPGCKLTIGSPAAPSSINSQPTTTSSGNNEESTCAEAKLVQASNSNSSAISSSSNSASQPRNREKLRQYLEEEFKKQYPSIKVQLDELPNVDRENRNKVGEEKIKNKEWDIAFTGSPLLAVSARDQGYQFAFAPKGRGEFPFETSIFVRRDSSIKGLGDLTANKVIALGAKEKLNLVGFYMPVYDLYGTNPRMKHINSMAKIPNMVLCKEVDAGVAPSRLVKQNPNFTILSNASIKRGGIYFSPNLSADAQKILKEKISNAPSEVQIAAGYDTQGEDLDDATIKRIRQIKKRSEELIDKGLVSGSKDELTGIIENIRHVTSDKDSISIKTASGKVYEIQISHSLIQKLNVDSDKLIKKQIAIRDVKANDQNVIQINEIGQIALQ